MRVAWWVILSWVSVLPVLAVYYDQPRAEVLRELGRPTSSITRGGREVMLFPNGVRIEFERGRVVFMQGIEPTEGSGSGPTAAEAEPDAPPPPDAVPKPAEPAAMAPKMDPQDEEEVKLTPEQAKALEEAEKEFAAANAKARAEMEKAIGDLEKIYEGGAAPPPAPRFDVVGFILEVFIAWVLMVAALKLTTKYWAVDIEWPGLLLAAAVDTVVKVAVRLVGVFALEMPMLFYADEAIAAVVLVFVLRKVSTNQRLDQAVTVTLTSKVFSVVVGSLLVTVLLHALH